jgi:hypothetical protein
MRAARAKSERVFAVALAGNNERVNDGEAAAGIGVADERPVLFSDDRMASDWRIPR